MAENPEVFKNSNSSIDRFSITVCETIGYAAFLAWLPCMILANNPARPDSLTFFSIPLIFDSIILKILCLLCCCLFGGLLLVFSDFFNKKAKYLILCVGAFAATIVSFFVPHDIFRVILYAISFSSCFFLWNTHLLNKGFQQLSLVRAILIVGCFLLACSLLDNNTVILMLSILPLISLSMFFTVSETTFHNWVFTTKEAMTRTRFSFSTKVFPFVISFFIGISCGAIFNATTSSLAFLCLGAAWVIVSACVFLYFKTTRKPSKSFLRGVFAVGTTCFVSVLAVTQGLAHAIAGASLAVFLISDKQINQLRHVNIKKDTSLSEPYLCGFRLLFATIGTILGLASNFFVENFFDFPSEPRFLYFALLSCILFLSCLINLGVFERKKVRLPVSSIADPWQEKVNSVAEQFDLTPRQTELLNGLSRGRNTRYLSERLYLSEGTIKKQVYLIYKKLDVHSQQELITKVMDTNIELPKKPSES